ncbi:MAG: hypothetical protein QOC95_903 [Thermoleophilaceae bacterium]|nr:hypothetical protein [Thermoleophilaceae bacterium]
MARELVDEVRRFNRSVTVQVGALNDRFLGRDRPLAEARLLWEIGTNGREVRSLRSRLGLDSAYLSRLLRSLERAGLVTVAPADRDRRIRIVRLTPAGATERDVLDSRSHEFAASLLEPLSPVEQGDLVAAMRRVQRLLTAGALEIRPTDPTDPDARSSIAAYFAELDRRSETGYDPAAGVSAEPDELRPPAGVLLLAYLHGEAVACGALKNHPGAPSEVKRMWVSESARGLGIGRRLLEALEARAREGGAPAARLETNRNLTEAIAMYRSAGYVEVAAFNDEPFADHWFEKQLA